MVLLNEDFTVAAASQNLDALFALDPQQLIGTPWLRHVTDPRRFRAQLLAGDSPLPALRGIRGRDGKRRRAHAAVRPRGDQFLVELEPAPPGPDANEADLFRQVNEAAAELEGLAGQAQLNELAAEIIRDLTGYRRVLVYELDASGDALIVGQAGGEARLTGLRVPLGKLQEELLPLVTQCDPFMVVDAQGPDVALVGKAPARLLQGSILRSPPPRVRSHLEHTGVRAAVMFLLGSAERPWGLVVAQDTQPRRLSPRRRSACRLLLRSFSWHLVSETRAQNHSSAALSQRALTRLTRDLGEHHNLMETLLHHRRDLLTIAEADGFVLHWHGQTLHAGKLPAAPERDSITAWLRRKHGGTLWVSDDAREAGGWSSDEAAGVLAMPLGATGQMAVWFRSPARAQPRWLYDPNTEGRPTFDAPVTPWQGPEGRRSHPWLPWQLEATVELREALLRRAAATSAELREANERLEEASQAKDEFLAMISHELRTPLNAMLGWLRLLNEGNLPPERQSQALEVVHRNAQAQAHLVEDLLDLSRATRGKLTLRPEPVDLRAIITRATELMEPAARAKGVRMVTELQPRSGMVLGDGGRLQQVLVNLAQNAVSFSEPGGLVRIQLNRVGPSVEMRVIDYGKGIPKDALPFIFDRFRQARGGAKRSHGGLGLGLAIAQQIVELHGGEIFVHSDGEGRGATFTVVLPTLGFAVPAADEQTPVAVAEAPQPPLPLESLRILVIDDEPDARELLAYVLGSAGAEVVTAANGFEALDLLGRSAPDLVISDVAMPEMDGYELLARIREHPQGGAIPAIAVTAFGRSEDRRRSLESGFLSHLTKPVDTQDLLQLVAKLWQQHRGQAPHS